MTQENDMTAEIEALVAEREQAYQAYINEVTPNGNTRMDNITMSNGPDDKRQRHIATQVDMAFQAGWSAALTALQAEKERLHKQYLAVAGDKVNLRSELASVKADLAAAVAAKEKAEGLSALRADHAEWSQAQFGDVSAVGPAKHLSKEALEVAADPNDAIEHADCWMLLWDMQRRAGISDAELAKAIAAKLAINKERKWPEPKEGEAREHDRAALPDAKGNATWKDKCRETNGPDICEEPCLRCAALHEAKGKK